MEALVDYYKGVVTEAIRYEMCYHYKVYTSGSTHFGVGSSGRFRCRGLAPRLVLFRLYRPGLDKRVVLFEKCILENKFASNSIAYISNPDPTPTRGLG